MSWTDPESQHIFQNENVPRGVEGVIWLEGHTYLSFKRLGVCFPFETKCHQLFPDPIQVLFLDLTKSHRFFPKHNHMFFLPKPNRSKVDIVRQDKMHRAQAFTYCLETLKGSLSKLAGDAKGWHLACLDMKHRGNDKTSVCWGTGMKTGCLRRAC